MKHQDSPCQKGQTQIIVIGILLIALVGAGVFYLGGQTSPKSTPSPVVSPTPQPISTPSIAKDETKDWKTYTNNDLEFKYPSNWNISGQVITSTSPKIRVVIVPKDGTLMNECMQEVSEETKNTLFVKKFERVTTGAMCQSSDPSPREIWVVPSKDAYSPGISYGYSANESAQAEEIFDQILSTFRFLDDLPEETGPQTSCVSNKDCWCKEFTGAEFIPGKKVEGVCDTKLNRCQKCVYY